MILEATLKTRTVKKGTEYRVEFIDPKGKQQNLPLQKNTWHFDPAKVHDNDPAQIEYENGQILKCTVPGKEAEPPRPKDPPKSRQAGGNYGSRQGNTSGQSGAGALCDAVAPYNFVPFEAGAVIPAFEDDAGAWSGRIICELEAKTPLLVAGEQTRKDADSPTECRFMRQEGKNLVAGTSVKGMLRSLLEILSFSRMSPLTDEHLFWRQVNRPAYRAMFYKNGEENSDEPVRGGFLHKRGAEYFLVPVKITPGDFDAPATDGCEKVKTGGFVKNGKQSKAYFFHLPGPRNREIQLDRDIVNTFWAQLTPNQESEKRWNPEKRKKRLEGKPGLPVFYRVDAEGKVLELGFCRYFRLKYQYSPWQLAYTRDIDGETDVTGDKIDFATRLFGTVEKDAFKGRVAVEPFAVEGKPYKENGMDVVLGGPKPTCLPLYLVQGDNVRLMKKSDKNDIETMLSYNDRSARLRGRKLYWHHKVDENLFPMAEGGAQKGRANQKVISRLYPLDAGARARLVIHVDRLTDLELGGLLEAIDLPAGHAHKLGMGKALGFGSVRLDIERLELRDIRSVHSSLEARLNGENNKIMDAAKKDELKAAFRRKVLEAMRKTRAVWKDMNDKPIKSEDINNYENLPPIKALRVMMDYKNKPTPEAVRTMKLRFDPQKADLTRVNFSLNAILPDPAAVVAEKKA